MFAATTFFRSARMSRRINWMLASLTCSSVVFTPLAGDGAACWALRTVVATNTAVTKQSGKAMFFFKFDSPFRSITEKVLKVTLELLTDVVKIDFGGSMSM